MRDDFIHHDEKMKALKGELESATKKLSEKTKALKASEDQHIKDVYSISTLKNKMENQDNIISKLKQTNLKLMKEADKANQEIQN